MHTIFHKGCGLHMISCHFYKLQVFFEILKPQVATHLHMMKVQHANTAEMHHARYKQKMLYKRSHQYFKKYIQEE
jgi:hypothetical protein